MFRRLPLVFRSRSPRITVLRFQGVIAGTAARGALSHAAMSPLIERGFRKGKPTAVALIINSPGGSPVQSALIGSHVRRLADELSCPVHAFVEDVAASGGYWLAAAADDIWVDHSSITGSIGVISAGFGFSELIARFGIERRVHTAGEDKSMLDPFRPERAEDVERLKSLQAEIHRRFISYVQDRRGTRLASDAALFDGEIYVGAQAVDVGLVDGVAHLVPKLRELYGADVKLNYLGQRRSLLQRVLPGVMVESLAFLDERASRARFGL